jgi:hypothetical protein
VIDGVAMPPGQITSFGEDACGELYVAAQFNRVFKIVGEEPLVDCNGNDVEDGCEIDLGLVAEQRERCARPL